jgi:FkbM family methyltransferase
MLRAINWLAAVVDEKLPRRTKRSLIGMVPGVDRWIYQTLHDYSPAAPAEIKIRGGPLRGRKFYCSLKWERDYWIGNHEPNVARLISSLLSAGDVFYDVGVHKGYFSLMAAQCVGSRGRVIGFEPNPHNLRDARRNLELNPDLAPRIQLEHLAVSDETGFVQFAGEPGSATGKIQDGFVATATSPDLCRVRAVSLDDIIDSGQPPPNLIKMDIEGGERQALRGLGKSLHNNTILIVEVHDEQAASVLADAVGSRPYKCVSLDDGRTFSTSADYREREQFVAFPKGHPLLDGSAH